MFTVRKRDNQEEIPVWQNIISENFANKIRKKQVETVAAREGRNLYVFAHTNDGGSPRGSKPYRCQHGKKSGTSLKKGRAAFFVCPIT
jgi:hypothetical protein